MLRVNIIPFAHRWYLGSKGSKHFTKEWKQFGIEALYRGRTRLREASIAQGHRLKQRDSWKLNSGPWLCSPPHQIIPLSMHQNQTKQKPQCWNTAVGQGRELASEAWAITWTTCLLQS